MIDITLAIFYTFAAILVAASLMVVCSHNSVRSALFLVLAFVCSSVLWLLAQAEFLALVLILVYVGAVMTLFLFVVMMLNVDLQIKKKLTSRYLPLGLLIGAALIAVVTYVVLSPDVSIKTGLIKDAVLVKQAADYNNVRALGLVLYTDYFYPFQLAGVLLLVAMIAAVSLVFRGSQSDSKTQDIQEQLKVSKQNRLRLIKDNEREAK